MRIVTFTVACSLLATASCTTPDGQKSHIGWGAAIGGALAGGACLALGGGGKCVVAGVAGAIAGGAIGQHLDARDKARRDVALRQALNDNRLWAQPAAAPPVQWSNPVTGNSGSIQPVASGVSNGRNCREYRERYIRNGEPVIEKRVSCAAADGTFT